MKDTDGQISTQHWSALQQGTGRSVVAVCQHRYQHGNSPHGAVSEATEEGVLVGTLSC